MKYRIQFDWPSTLIYSVDSQDSGVISIDDIPVSPELRFQILGLSDLFDEGMSAVIFHGKNPTKLQKIEFRKMYEFVIPRLKSGLPNDWVLESEEFPGIFKD